MPEYATFAKFHNIQEAHSLISLLVENNISYATRQEMNHIDPIIIGNSIEPMVVVTVPVEEFSKVNSLLRRINIDGPLANYSSERLDVKWIIASYILGLFPFVGVLCGLAIIASTKRLSNGHKVKMYDRYSLRHGKIILAIGILSTIVRLLFQVQLKMF